MIDEKELMELREKLQFNEARADIMELCDCKLYPLNLKWVLDFVKNEELGGYKSYFSAKEYIEEALKDYVSEYFGYDIYDMDYKETKDLKEHLQDNGIFTAVGLKMLNEARNDFYQIGIMIDDVDVRSDAASLSFNLGDFEKKVLIENFKDCLEDSKFELLAKHKTLFEKLDIYSILEQEADYSNTINQEQRAGRIRRQ